MQALSLELAVGVYPLSLLLATYMLIRLYDRNFTPSGNPFRWFYSILGVKLKREQL